jgi:hypothetical protein
MTIPPEEEIRGDEPSLRAPGDAEPVILHCSRGQVEARVGDEFSWFGEGVGSWRIESFTRDRIYSPSGFGGTPIVRCRPVGEMPPTWAKYDNGDGTVDWCGDSVGAALLGNRKDGSSQND